MDYVDYKEHQIRIIDQRPKSNFVQVNIYNPQDSGHSLAAFLSFVEDGPTDAMGVYETAVESGVIDAMLERAQLAFAVKPETE